MSSTYPKLNFPPINLRAKRHEDGKTILVWSSPRGCYLVLTPEEWVRRHLVEYLLGECNIQATDIIEEYPIPLNGQAQRADLVVVKCGKPQLLVECKAPEVKLSQEVFAQAARYNSTLGARYIILTNGLKHLCFELHDTEYTPLSGLPNI